MEIILTPELEKSREELEQKLERCKSLYEKFKAPSFKVCMERTSFILHQLMEWNDFLKRRETYEKFAKEGDERAQRMLEMLNNIINIFKNNPRKRRFALNLGLVKFTEPGRINPRIVFTLYFEKQNDTLLVKTKYMNLMGNYVDDFYGD